MADYRPVIGNWYKAVGIDAFEVVAADEDDQLLEIQYIDGALEEIDFETWETLHPHLIEPPQEAVTALFDDLDDESDNDGARPGPDGANGDEWILDLEQE